MHHHGVVFSTLAHEREPAYQLPIVPFLLIGKHVVIILEGAVVIQ